MVVPYFLGWVSLNDIKLIATLGSFVGPDTILTSAILGTGILLLFISIYILFRRKVKVKLSLNLKLIDLENEEKVRFQIPLGFFLAISAMVYWLLYILF
nr:hypothetical protein [Natranaerofaba carboxydovora]